MELYTRDDHRNMQNNCSLVHYEQLLNDKLYVAAFNVILDQSPCLINADHRLCEGTKRIQDYIPRYYYFSFGINCNDNGSLQGLSYNMSIVEQSNGTECSLIPGELDMQQSTIHTLPYLILLERMISTCAKATKQAEAGMRYMLM